MVRVVTDSTCDIPAGLARELGITVVPLYLRLGEQTYRDGVDIDIETLHRELSRGGELPQTSSPSPGDFVGVYQELSEQSNEIISIHLSPGYSGTCNSARLAQGYLKDKCRVEVIDSGSVSAGMGLIVIAAAQAAREGKNLNEIVSMMHSTIPRTYLFGKIGSLAHVIRGRRLRLTGWLIFSGKIAMKMHIKLVGELYGGGRIRRASLIPGELRTLKKLVRWAEDLSPIKEIAIAHSLNPAEAEMLIHNLEGVASKEQIMVTQLGCVTTTYGGAGTLAMAVMQRE